MARGVFEAARSVTANGPTNPFLHKFGTAQGGLPILVAVLAAGGTFDGATISFEFKLAGQWHVTTVAITDGQRFWKLDATAAIIGEMYRFTISGAGASTNLSISVAAPLELTFNGSS